MKDHQIARLANKLTEIAKKYTNHECLRTLISKEIVKERDEYIEKWQTKGNDKL